MSILGEASFQKSLVVSLSLHRAMKTRKNYAVFLLFYAKLNSLKFKCLVYREVFQRVLFLFCPAGILVGEEQRWDLHGFVVESPGDNRNR